MLHSAQETFGHLDEDILDYVSRQLKLPPSWVYGVATFYNFFSLDPQGEHVCVVCMGTACYVKGGNRVLSSIEEHMGVRAGETTPDNQVSLLTARCIGACGIAPAVVYDGKVTPRQNEDEARERIEEWMSHGS